ncbi:MAG: hypothetical protein ACHQ3P_10300 [Candidatus Limnocylindrales bacterium]
MHQTDEPIETTDAVVKEVPIDADDTEGHSLSSSEFHQGLARERSRETDKYAAEQARRRDVPRAQKKSLLDRLTGR